MNYHDKKVLLSLKDVRDKTNLSRTTLYALFKGGKLAFVKVGNRTFVRPADLDAFVAGLEPRGA